MTTVTPTDDFEDDGLYVNFSDEEAASEARDIEPLPSGKYLVRITDVDMREVQSSKNLGKPMYNIEFTVIGDKANGQYVNRKCWTIACLFPPALYTISHLMKALNMSVTSGRVRIPKPEELIDQVVVIGGAYVGEQEAKDGSGKKYPPKYEVKSIFAETKWAEVTSGKPSQRAGTATSKGSSLLS